MNNILHLLGIAKKAGKLEIGEEPTGAAARARQAKLILVARDAADNTFRRVRHFADAGNVIWVSVPATKDELGRAVGRTSCAMLTVMDVGIAASIAQKLAAIDPEKYTITAEKLGQKSKKSLQRQKEKRQHEKNLQKGRRKPAPQAAPKPEAKQLAPKPGKPRPPRPKAGAKLKLGSTFRPKTQGGKPSPSPGAKRRER
jgi:ribosomal protein L7Ae-like RNA K-turn-binding protein